ncbi:acyl-CoA thioesterase domain-containing protein [Actinocorallia longicatena]|uniref:Thioesterase family protein n=1 Tax=Actinocorallia longicatena TaxID=111803 RepID=A0ABP6PX93_9ACTN
MVEAFFTVKDGEFTPGPLAVGPWGPAMMNGRVVGGLLARSVEHDHGDAAFRPARFTVDLLRPASMAPVTVTTTLVRTGRRIKIVDALLRQGETLVARAGTVFLRHSTEPAGRIWAPDDPMPVPPPPAEHGKDPDGSVYMWPHSPGKPGGDGPVIWQGTGRHSAWIRENRPLVEDEELTPFVRAALAGDVASPMSHWGSAALEFINTDYTLALGRLPEGPDIGLQTTLRTGADGISTGTAVFHDHNGPFGTCTVVALANVDAGFTLRQERH